MAQTDDRAELDRRHFLKCMAWVGTGAVWTLSSGVLKGAPLGQAGRGRLMPQAARRSALRADQRQPHRVRQAGKHRRHGHAAKRRRHDHRRTRTSCIRSSYRRSDASLEARGVRHASTGAVGAVGAGLLRPRRARRARGRGQELSAAIRQRDAGSRVVQLRPQRRALHRTGERCRPEGRRTWHAWHRTARVARERCRADREQHADRRLCPHSALVGLP